MVTILLNVLLARCENWPEFRGPTGQGLVLSGSLPTEWSATRNVAWRQAIPGTGWSSPIIYEGRVYLTTAVPVPDSPNNDQSLQALCLDAETGNILWNMEVYRQDGQIAPSIHPKNSHASPTPVADGQRLYVHFGHQGTACLDLSGKVLWRSKSLSYKPIHGNGGSPILTADAIVFSCDGLEERFLGALKRKTGEFMWKAKREGEPLKKFSFSTPLLIAVNGKQQIISPGSNVVSAYDPITGKEIWRVQYEGYSVIPRPAYGHGLVFVCTGYDSPSLMAIRPDGQGDVTESHVAWKISKYAPHTGSPLLAGDELYMVSDGGLASCLDARTGRVHWQQRIGGGNSASPIHANGKIYFLSEEGLGVVVKASKQFERLARNRLDERTLASYAAAGGALYIRTEKHLYRIQQK
jgi:outer membrane protein assembly factor BamB